ncbi:MAG TPA: NUDIX domain-containing protein [Acidimicrobiales bacterium]
MGMSPYFARIREKVGNDLLQIPGVSVLPWDSDGRLLLVSDSSSGPWGLVGGAIEPDEEREDAARREAFEEIGVVVEITGLRGVLGGPSYHVIYENGDEVSYVSTVYDARIGSGILVPDFDEVHELGWFDPGEMMILNLDDFASATLLALGVFP